jgi:uncharacterized protein YuzE
MDAYLDHQARVLETVAEPEMILQGDLGELLALRFYRSITSRRQIPCRSVPKTRFDRRLHLDRVLHRSSSSSEGNPMETTKILDRPASINWDYDEDADVLYLSLGEPRPAVGIDIGDGLVLRYDEERHEVAGLTVIGLRQRLLSGLESAAKDERG